MGPRFFNEVTMPAERLSMRKIRDVLRMKFEIGLSERAIARSLSLSSGGVNGYLQRARVAGLSWPLPGGLEDAALERLLFPPPPSAAVASTRPVPDWAAVEKELRRRGVTLALLWEEYRAVHSDGFGYSWFCEQHAAFKQRMRPTMRQTHVAGEKAFVDFAGDTIDIVDPATGEVLPMKLFVAVMGASNYLFAQARASEKIADWIGAHVDLFAFLGGVPKFVVCDNLKAAVTNPDRYEPGLNRSPANPTLSRFGSAAGSPRITTSRSTVTGIRRPSASSRNSSTRASPTRPLRFSTRASASPAIRARRTGAATPRSPSTCRVPIAAMAP
jgi:transposase